MKKALIALSVLIVAAVLTAGGAIMWAQEQFVKPGPLITDTTVVVKRGQGVRQIARSLQQAGVIEYDWLFAGMVRLREQHLTLAAGEYRFEAGISPAEALDKIQRQEVVVRSITIPEGLTSLEVVALIEEMDGLSGQVTGPVPAEGSLLPETYHFTLNDDRMGLVARMQKAMDQARQDLWAGRQAGLPVKTWHEAVILASIVEKETGLAAERPHVASVFVNRLNKGMRLQSDPTVRYALTDGKKPLGRALTRQDWKLVHPYNTYVIPGLPPGAIANPGLASIKAVLNPLQTKDLYFVADGSGGHAFARTLKEHNRNVARWRKFKKQQQGN
ncbi:endolytic transglycosylase MltG [Aestuariispira insulae]|uniref:Endolytic murein transglycosylase n=1 Tax=Aestuariispira insulae TaxID=1461337 RepID=A0A3D9HVN7_9PROT|nr:endolytic transglycosylase MltG [Aestuariispira insulae]RED53527.1 UPF0755 protein [Aestuariispira insulae]